MDKTENTGNQGFRDEVFQQLSVATDGLRSDERMPFAVALIVALCEKLGSRRAVNDAIADARRAVLAARSGVTKPSDDQ